MIIFLYCFKCVHSSPAVTQSIISTLTAGWTPTSWQRLWYLKVSTFMCRMGTHFRGESLKTRSRVALLIRFALFTKFKLLITRWFWGFNHHRKILLIKLRVMTHRSHTLSWITAILLGRVGLRNAHIPWVLWSRLSCFKTLTIIWIEAGRLSISQFFWVLIFSTASFADNLNYLFFLALIIFIFYIWFTALSFRLINFINHFHV